jgi:hypothetical protein
MEKIIIVVNSRHGQKNSSLLRSVKTESGVPSSFLFCDYREFLVRYSAAGPRTEIAQLASYICPYRMNSEFTFIDRKE